MRSMRWIALGLSLALLPAAASLSSAQGGASGDVTVSGEIVDLACYIAHGAKGPDHAKCAQECAKQGQPIGLAGTDGKVYLLFADHGDGAPYDKAKTLAGSKAEIKGEPATKDGINGLTVHAVKKI
jgi:hypothetical protein